MADQGENRETFLASVRQPLGRSQTQPPTEPPPEVDQSLMRLASAEDDLVELFATRAGDVGMDVHRCNSEGGLEVLEALVDQVQPNTAVVGLSPGDFPVDVQSVFERRGVELLDWAGATTEGPYFEADIGLTDVHAALAESGTLICCADRSHGRALSLAPPIHIALVRASDIVPDMIDYWARLKGIPGQALPSSQTLISGPSKTADIEGELITGVHGPAEVHIVLIEDA